MEGGGGVHAMEILFPFLVLLIYHLVVFLLYDGQTIVLSIHIV